MGEGACKGTKGWTFNKKSIFLKKKHSNPQNLNEDAKQKKWCLTIFMARRHYQNSLGNIEQLVDPEGPITFFKYD